jgi:molecular chaperone DnaK (HSP70)
MKASAGPSYEKLFGFGGKGKGSGNCNGGKCSVAGCKCPQFQAKPPWQQTQRKTETETCRRCGHSVHVHLNAREHSSEDALASLSLDVAAGGSPVRLSTTSLTSPTKFAGGKDSSAVPWSKGQHIVAIDFGTSRSAYALTCVGSTDSNIFLGVPNDTGTGLAEMKTASSILLEANGDFKSFGFKAEEDYINEADMSLQLFKWFKMDLRFVEAGQSVDDIYAKASNGQETTKLIDVIVKSLEFIMRDAMDRINGTLTKLTQLTPHAIVWVLTVPAIWTDFGKHFMREAAFRAGLVDSQLSDKLILCLEPEAAAVQVLFDDNADLIEDGCQFMIVDCGGGTADITTSELESSEPFSLKEVATPAGGPWGSTEVDKNFIQFLSQFLGEHHFSHLQTSEVVVELLKKWEAVKITIKPEDTHASLVTLSGVFAEIEGLARSDLPALIETYNASSEHKIERHGKAAIKLPAALIMSFFSDAVDKITARVTQLLDTDAAGVKHVFLVGGFCESPVLQARIKSIHTDANIIIPNKPSLAVVRGAALCGLRPGMFASRKARVTYASAFAPLYDESNPVHANNSELKYTGDDGKERITVLHVYVEEGEDVPVGHKVRNEYYPMTIRQRTCRSSVYLVSNPRAKVPSDPGVQLACSVSVGVQKLGPALDDRGFQVEFAFGDTELRVAVYSSKTGHKIDGAETAMNFMA